MEWNEQFEIVKKVFAKAIEKRGGTFSISALDRFLDLETKRARYWERGQRPSASDLIRISDKLGLSLRWLISGDGEPFDTTSQQDCPPVKGRPLKPVPMVGLASCGVEGWNKPMSIAVNASPIVLGDNTVAVVAAGESMVPAGIASGQLCYCDPDQPVLAGDAVYIVRRDNMATIKLYLGEGERAGWIRLQGWLDPDTIGLRKPFYVDLLESEIVLIAPVIYERRRL